MKFGLPYRGSKSSIAQDIINHLPSADIFIDAFGGGGAITHAAAISNKYKKIIYNEIQVETMNFFKEAVQGNIGNYNWISKKDFFDTKEDNVFNRLCWSFGNNGRGYIYGESIEEIKHAVWLLIYQEDPSLLKNYNLPIANLKEMDLHSRRIEAQHFYSEYFNKKFQLESAIQIERVQKLKNFENSTIIEYLNKDYSEIEIPENAIIYCDPPYKDSTEESYSGNFTHNSFDYNRFYNWARKQKNIYISEYYMPEDFLKIFEINKVSRAKVNGSLIKTEKLFTI